MSIGLSVICTVLSWFIITGIENRPFLPSLTDGRAIPVQILLGSLYGSVAGLICLFLLLAAPVFEDLRNLFIGIINDVNLNPVTIILISALAGFSEEFLFRGGLQPLIGLWWSSALFIALHGYFNPRNWRITLYGLLMFALSIGLGLMYQWVGLLAAIFAHTMVDVVILLGLLVNQKYYLK
ncbi:hypothetical protein LX24_02911 [Desulfallas thermosapovorans DSM 6562]|uniref:CAAX prenyl protease 2/Lysostaphin resistance protein A-like domain-containing protein n=1 Tax=Desulfallas thermosapovorans DSM 6562 TaxID=1121431 RepID=A0A5S4ZPR1_9FIRM|nr:hypothetical protein LX24_02911 [Desulfallas thermosapovorans DSM 6562]